MRVSRDSQHAFSRSGDETEASESSVHLDNVLISNEITTAEYLKMCFKPSYRMRRLKNKGALLVLVLNFLASYAYYYLNALVPESYSNCSVCFRVILVPSGVVLIFAGWLADIRLGRYNVLYWSSLTMWLSSVLPVISAIVTRVAN